MVTGKRIRELRIKAGLSQEELGEKVGVQKAAIHKYESGIVVNLKQSTIARLAKALDTTPAYLMGWDDEESEQDELDELLQEIKDRPELQLLFSKTGKATKEDIMKVVEIFEIMKKTNPDLDV